MADDKDGPVFPVREQKRVVEIRERELPYAPSNPMSVLKDRNGVSFTFDKTTHVAIRDSKGKVSIFAKDERSGATVNNRLYSFYQTKRYGEPRGRIRKEKPFVASVVPFEAKPSKAFVPFVVTDKEEGN